MRFKVVSLLAAAISFGAMQAASAADMPVKAPAYQAPAAYNWTGFYLGGHIGGGWSHTDWNQTFSSFALALDSGSANANGFLGGAQAGYNYQMGQFVLGLEGDFSWTDMSGTGGHSVFTNYSGTTRTKWTATITPRIGYAWQNALLYAKGGVAFEADENTINFSGAATTNTVSATRTGWTVGAGVEYGFWNNWSAKLEYDYLDFGTKNYALTYFAHPAGLVENWDIRHRIQQVKFGINDRFN
jgi:outer membrane immunogenic protein